MGRSGGAGEGGSLDFSHHTYEELRAAVYGVSGEGLAVACNQVADLKRMLNERAGTLSVVVAKLALEWSGPGGRLALGALRRQLGWFTEFARVVSWNGERLAEVTDAFYTAQAAMRELENAPERPNPNPAPAPSGGRVHPSELNWRQPAAARIANYLFSEMAVAAATFALPPPGAPDIKTTDTDRKGGVPGDGPVITGYGPGGTSDPGDASGSSRRAGGGPSGGARPGASPPAGLRPAGSSSVAGARARSRSGAASDPGTARGGPIGAGTGQGVSGGRAAGGVGQVAGGGRSVGQPGVVAPGGGTGGAPVNQPVGRTLGGGSRPPSSGTQVPPGSGSGNVPPGGRGLVPPGGMPGAGVPVQGGQSGRRRQRLERGDPDLFRSTRRANRAGGEVRRPADEQPVGPAPSTIGSQKLPREKEPWAVPDPPKVPAGFPEKLQSFTRADGARFEVRRVQGG